MNKVELIGKVGFVNKIKESTKGKKFMTFTLSTKSGAFFSSHTIMCWEEVALSVQRLLEENPNRILFVSGSISYNIKQDKSKDTYIVADLIYPIDMESVRSSKSKANASEKNNNYQSNETHKGEDNCDFSDLPNEFGF